MYSNGEDDTHMGYTHVIAVSNYYRVQQEQFQSLQDYLDQFITYSKVCEQLGIKIGESEDGAANILKKEKSSILHNNKKMTRQKRQLRNIMPSFSCWVPTITNMENYSKI